MRAFFILLIVCVTRALFISSCHQSSAVAGDYQMLPVIVTPAEGSSVVVIV